jgi:hypothetical protein
MSEALNGSDEGSVKSLTCSVIFADQPTLGEAAVDVAPYAALDSDSDHETPPLVSFSTIKTIRRANKMIARGRTKS